MNGFSKNVGRLARALGLFALLLTLAACRTGGNSPGSPGPGNSAAQPGDPTRVDDGGMLRINDLVTIRFTGITAPPPPHEERIKDDGTITPTAMFPAVKAAGLTPLQLQRELQRLYDQFYRNLTVTVHSETRFFYVKGEVKAPSRYPYAGEITVLRAIATAGDFTDFANRRRIQLTRVNGRAEVVDGVRAQRDSKLDPPVFPGDTIEVPRRYF